ncbi:MAG: nitroreductase family protein [Pseudomonadota bacterium]
MLFFDAAVDAAIALSAAITAAEQMGLGCCPISAVRNQAETVSALLNLPDFVFPVAGLALGYRNSAAVIKISPRLPFEVTFHENCFSETDLRQSIERYDVHRRQVLPYRDQRSPETFGLDQAYSWSEDKTRQYALPERASFGAFVRKKGFNLT